MSPVVALRGAACLHHSPSPCFGRQNGTHRKNREVGGAARPKVAAISSSDTTSNQRLDAVGGGNGDEMRSRRNAWGGFVPVVWGAANGAIKEREGGTGPQP
jgi:hypothetical protein